MTGLIIRLPNADLSQIQGSTDIETLLDTAADCLRFVTEFFEAISQSAPHIYHSTLLLAPTSSMVRELYAQYIHSPMVRVVTGMPASWDSCTACIGGASPYCIDWSPCGQFIAAASEQSIDILGSGTLERVSTFGPPCDMSNFHPQSLTFSPGGHLLACSFCYKW